MACSDTFQAFYVVGKGPISSWKPLLLDPISLSGSYAMTCRSEVKATPLVILHFIMSGISTAGSPAIILHEFLKPYLPGDRLHYKEISFNLSHSITKYAQDMKALVVKLKK